MIEKLNWESMISFRSYFSTAFQEVETRKFEAEVIYRVGGLVVGNISSIFQVSEDVTCPEGTAF